MCLLFSSTSLTVFVSGTAMRMQKTCRFVPSHDSSRRCSTRSASSPTTSTTSSVALRRTVRHSLPTRHGKRVLTIRPQAPARSTPLILWDHMNARHVALRARHKPWCSLSWTIRCGLHRYVRGPPILTRLPPAPDILQEPASTGRIITSRTLAATRRAFYRH